MDDHYGAIKFGEFRKYMQNKQAKLKDQERALEHTASQSTLPQIFQGLSIYINGYTNPSQSELRRLIILHGGNYQHYLKKSSVTHIVASNLTQSKLHEFRAYKVVKPSWITDSIEAKELQPWPQYRVIVKESAQKELVFHHPQQQEQQQQEQQQPEGKTLNAALLANPWNKENTSVQPGFIEKFYESSRLHHLSTWRAELKEMVGKMEQKYTLGKRKRSSGPRIVMHIDFDCFFASVGLLDRQHLKEKPVAVAHGQGRQENSSSDIASCNYIARSFGLYNGMHIGVAKKKCPELQVIPYEFEKYKAISEMFYETLFEYAEQLQPVSVDEALIQVDGNRDPLELAQEIRQVIRDKTQCEVSIGIGSNILLARLATKKAKPAGQYFCQKDQAMEFLAPLDVSDLPGVGYRMASKIQEDLGVSQVGELAKIPLGRLQHYLGPKTGKMLYNYSRGIDDRELQMFQPRQSVSADVNWGVRFENEDQVKNFVMELGEEVSRRLHNIQQRGKSITVKILRRHPSAGEAEKRLGCGECDSFSKSIVLDRFTDDASVIGTHAYQMLSSFGFDPADLRGIGIQVQKLDIRNVGKQQTLQFAPAKERTPDNDQQLEMSPLSTPSPERQPITTVTAPSSPSRPSSPSKATLTPAIREKPVIHVDPSVFAELPKSVQDDLSKTHKVEFLDNAASSIQVSQQNQPTSLPQQQQEQSSALPRQQQQQSQSQYFHISQPDLPPWSQLDPEFLLALPERTRKQVLETYSKTRAQKTTPTTTNDQPVEPPRPTPLLSPHRNQHELSPSRMAPPHTPRNSRQRNTRRIKKGYASPSGRERTLTQMLLPDTSPSRHPPSPTTAARRERNEEEMPPWDVNIWNELPPDVKQEILFDYRREKRMQERQLRDEHFRQVHDKLMQSESAPALAITIPKEPELMGKHTMQDIRGLLKQWVDEFPEHPEKEDVETVTRYLCELVQTKYLDKVQMIVMYLVHLTSGNNAWTPYIETLQQQVSHHIQEIYHCPIKFS